MVEIHRNYVDGEWLEAGTGETFEVQNPANGEVVGEFQLSDADDAVGGIETAAAASAAWADTPGPDRGALLRAAARQLDERSEELAETLTREEGKTLAEARPEVGRAVDIFYYYAEKAREFAGTRRASSSPDQRLYTVPEPIGVAGLVTPWNYPIAIPAWKSAPALATGNTVVLKPANEAPGVARILFECLDAAGFPAGVVNLVTGPGSEVGETIVTHEEVDCVSFTGSRSVGEGVYGRATDRGKRIQTELGSKNPTVVTESADVEEAVEIVGAGAFDVTGQACTATSRAIVHESKHREFVDAVVAYAEGLDVGPGLDGHDVGPQVNADELDGTLEYVEIGQEEGATLETGGGRPEGDGLDDGHFVEPTVFSGAEPGMRIMQEEIFGPVVAVTSYGEFAEAIELSNGVEFGLSASVVTGDHAEANRYVDGTDFGVIKVNEKTTGLELHVPFGGMNASSSETYREQGDAALDFYTITKTVYDNF
jgi:aldehyde dehydrogenase (NAD+)